MSRRDTAAAVLLLALALNSAYLAARADASLFYFANVALHVGLGLVCSSVLSRLARRAWPSLDGPWRAAAALFAAGSILGVALLFTGATRPYRPLLYAHAVLVGLAALVALAAGARRALAFAPPLARAAAVAAAVLAAAAPVSR